MRPNTTSISTLGSTRSWCLRHSKRVDIVKDELVLNVQLYFMSIIIPYYLLILMKLHRLSKSVASVKLVSPPCVFTAFNNLAEATGAINLGAGTPSCSPPEFITEAFQRYVSPVKNHPSKFPWKPFFSFNLFSSMKRSSLNDSIASIYSSKYDRKLVADKNILVSSGARDALHCTLSAFLSKGDEVIVFDPSYEIYRNSILKTGAVPISIPLIPKNKLSKGDISSRSNPYRSTSEDRWQIDFSLLSESITPRTKALILSSPHNPTGKIFSHHQLSSLACILNRHKNITILDDRVYQHTNFDDNGQDVPDISQYPGMFERTVSIFSAGKLLRVPGLMCGWIIASEGMVQRIRRRCPTRGVEEGVGRAVGEAMGIMHREGNKHMLEFTNNMDRMRRALLKVLYESKYDFNMWVPQAGYFVIVDVTKIDVDQKYYWDHDGSQKLAKDFAFCNMLCKEDGVAAIPCSSFFDKKHNQEQFVRFAFCKDLDSIEEAGKRMKAESSAQDLEASTYYE